jgi:hypothetical protein
MNITIPNIVYGVFNNAFRAEFLKYFEPEIKEKIEDQPHKMWFEKVPGSFKKTVIEAEFSPINIAPKYLYNKNRDAENGINPQLKCDIFIRACEKILKLKPPPQITLWSELKPDKMAEVFLQIFLESYAPIMFAELPQLKVFDRIAGKFCDNLRNDDDIIIPTVGAKSIDEKENPISVDSLKIVAVIRDFIFDNAKPLSYRTTKIFGRRADKSVIFTTVPLDDISDLAVFNIQIVGNKASCIVFYKEVALIRTSNVFLELQTCTLNKVVNLLEKNSLVLNSENLPQIEFLPFREIINGSYIELLDNGDFESHKEKLNRFLNKTELQRITRLKEIELTRSLKNWIISNIVDIEINYIPGKENVS